MSGSVNKVILVGNVGADPELKYTTSGAAVANFRVATSDRRKNAQGGYDEQTEWHSIVCWNQLAEQANQLLTKGRKVYIEGKLTTRSWDGQDGQKHYKTEIIGFTFQLLDPRPQQGNAYGDDNVIPLDDVRQ